MNIIKSSIQLLKVSTKEIFLLILLLIGLAYLSFKNFLLFHTIAEIIPITISMIITLIAVNSYKLKGNNSLSFLGMAYFFIGLFDLIHTLTYKGMGVFPHYDANVPTQLWIMARYMESISLLMMASALKKKLNIPILTLIYSAVSLFLLLCLFQWGLFPDCFIEDVGLTLFKKTSEYIISIILLIGLQFLIKNRDALPQKVFSFMLFSFVFTIISELAFVFYVDVYGLSNMIGHLFKLISFYLVYKAIIETNLKIPYDLLRNTNKMLYQKREELNHINQQLQKENETRSHVEKELIKKNQLLEAILATSNEGILVTDAANNILMVNDYFKIMWDIPQNFVFEKYDGEFVSFIKEKTIEVSDEYIAVVQELDDYYHEGINYVRLKNKKILACQYRPFTVNGSVAGQVISYRDVTEGINAKKFQEKFEKEEKLLKEVREYDRLKTEFFSNVSHELKTPLNIILGTVQLLDTIHQEQETLSCQHYHSFEKYIYMLRQNCYRLLRLIDNLIDITRIDTGFLKVNLKNQNIVSVIEDITLSVSEYIKDRGLNLIFDTEIEEKILACDLDKIERIILNLLSNAIKFTNSNGFIKVHLYDGVDYIKITVKDNGVGIPEDMKEKIFRRFRQVDALLSRKAEGSGIGLSLVKSLVEAHGGRIWVESQWGHGSEFFIELPVRLVQDTSAKLLEETAATFKSNVEKISIEFSDIYNSI